MGCCGDSDVAPEEPKSYDPNFKGPIKNRSCTDIICCLIFFVYVLGYIVIGLFAWLNGDPIILLNPTDNQGRICGVNYGDLDLTGKNYLFFFDVTECANPSTTVTLQCKTTQICVAYCPRTYWTYLPEATLSEARLAAGFTREQVADTVLWSEYICTYGFNARTEFLNGMSIQSIVSAGKCAPYYLPQTPVAGRCIPQALSNAVSYSVDVAGSAVLVDANGQNITGPALSQGLSFIQAYLNAKEIADKIFADFSASWYWLLVGLGVAALVSFLWIVLMRWIAGIIVWTTLLGLIGLISFGVWFCYDEWNRLKPVAGSEQTFLNVGFTTQLDTYLALQDTWLAFLIILSVLDVILIIIVIFLRKQIQIAIAVIHQASKAIGYMVSTLFYPLVTFVLVLIVLAFWAATALFLASTGDPVYTVIDSRGVSESLSGQTCNITEWTNPSHPFYLNEALKCVFDDYGGSSIFHQQVIWLQVIAAFGMLWLMNWVIALGQMTLAGAFASYYWAWEKPRDIPLLPVYASFGRSLRYHTGSLAFGSLLIAIVQLVRIVLEYISSKLQGRENAVAKVLVCCCKCCFWCLEKFLQFMNRNAYIMVAIYGKNFCWSAKEALSLLIRNILRTAAVDRVTVFLMFMGKLIVGGGMGALSWAFFTNKFVSVSALTAPALNYYWFMVAVIGVGSFFVASGFFNTFGMAVDTIFLCFLEDLERNDGSLGKPYYMSKGLRKVLGKKNKKPKKVEE